MSYLWLKLYADLFDKTEIPDILLEAVNYSTLNKINIELDLAGTTMYIVPYTTLQTALARYEEKRNGNV